MGWWISSLELHAAPPGETKEGRTHVYWVRPSAMS